MEIRMKKEKKKGLIMRFIPYYKPHMKLFTIDMICAFVISCVNLVYPIITRNIINTYVPNKAMESMIIALAALLSMYIIKALLNFVLQYWGHLVGVRMQADMRRELFNHLEKMPFSYFDENKTGSILSRLTSDLFEISELAHHGPEDIFLSLITLIGSFAVLSQINLLLSVIIFAFIPIGVIFIVFMRQRLSTSSKKLREKTSAINAQIESSISGIRVARAYCSEEHEAQRFEECNAEFVQANGQRYKVMGQFFSSMQFYLDIIYFVVLTAGGVFYYFGKIDLTDFLTYLLYISTLISPIRVLASIFEQIQLGLSGFQRFTEIMDMPTEKESENAVDIGRLAGDIVFSDVTFSYDNKEERNVIDGFDMHIPAGKTVALVGPSGGGKTTICHLIPRFYDIESGKITIDGIDTSTMTRSSLRKNIAIVQQDVFLFNATIKENIAYGDHNATDEMIIAAAKRANIHDYILTLPDGYDTNIGERGVKLSGGQKQRISIARAFLKNAPILILDEATSALDNATEMLIQESLAELSKGRTTLVVAHRLSTVKNADEILVITDEGVKESGSHEELIAMNGIYKTLYDFQFKNL